MAVGATQYLYKPQGENTGKPVVILPPKYNGQIGDVSLIDENGNVTGSGNYRHQLDQTGGAIYDLPHGNGSAVRVSLKNGQTVYYGGGGNARNEGGPINFTPSGSGSGSNSNGSSGGGGDFGNVSDFGDTGGADVFIPDGTQGGGSSGGAALPFFQPFPDFPNTQFPSIKAAPYDHVGYDPVDVQDFAKNFGAFNKDAVKQNFKDSQDLSLQALDTELRGLKQFAPAAAALSREQTSIDNQLNQRTRTEQVNSTLPGANKFYTGARSALAGQAQRAQAYAEGRLPNAALDQIRDTNLRGGAADNAGFSGIGPRSQAARKVSDLMSADARFQIGQYGESLINANIGQGEQLVGSEANLKLAPTEYSQVGQQIRPTPEVGAGRLTYQGADMLNQETTIAPTNALTATIQQRQFGTQSDTQQNQFSTTLDQRTREFNATGKFDASQINAAGQFQSAIGKFSNDTAYLNALQAANQQNLNTAAGLNFQGLESQNYNSGVSSGQASQQIESVGAALGTIGGAVSGITDLLNTPTVRSPIDTSPSPAVGVSSNDQGGKAAQAYVVPSGGSSAPITGGMVGTAPATYRIAPGASVPSGYIETAQHEDGGRSVTSISDYKGDLERFAKFTGQGNVPGNIPDAVAADKAVATSAGLSFIPIQGFQQIAMSSSGRPVYSLPAAAQSGDIALGRDKTINAALAANQLGVSDPAIYDALVSTGVAASDPDLHSHLDQLYAKQGEGAVASAILDKVAGGKPDTDTKVGKQLTFAALRIAELWPNLSPMQRSAAISSLAPMAVKSKTGKDISAEKVPGTETAPGGPLTVGKAVQVTEQGRNGFALARNWHQLSAVGKMVGASDPKDVAALSDYAGFLGYGPQGAAVPINAGQLSKVNATPAPEMGVGAMSFKSKTDIPSTYSVITQAPDKSFIAMPKNLVHTSTVTPTSATPLGYKKALTVATHQHPAQRLWEGKPSRRAVRGSAGGSAIVSGMGTLPTANPALAGAIAAYSLYNHTLGA